MNALFKKLNYKYPAKIYVKNPPDVFKKIMLDYEDLKFVKSVSKSSEVHFAICFATKQKEVDQIAKQYCPQLKDDATLWLCYPKKSSKRYTCEFNRDTGFYVLGEYGLEGVRMVAIDEDWSALRFRKVQYIKNFTRNSKMILSKEGHKRKMKA